jgi:hypothetical protein
MFLAHMPASLTKDLRPGGLGQAEYPATSLGNKSLEKVVKDIVELLVPEKAVGAQFGDIQGHREEVPGHAAGDHFA